MQGGGFITATAPALLLWQWNRDHIPLLNYYYYYYFYYYYFYYY